jgi:hypothetical protein
MALERVLAHPLGLPGCGAQQMFWRFPILAKQYAPFLADWRFVILSYPPEDGSPRSTLFRRYGIELPYLPETATWDELWWPAVGEVARLVWFLVTVCIGAASVVRRLRAPALAVLLTIVVWGCIIGLTTVLDSRYFLALSPGIYLAEAVGIVAIAKRLFQPPTFCLSSSAGSGSAVAALNAEPRAPR